MEEEFEIDLKEIWCAIYRKLWVIILCTLIIGGSFGGVTKFLIPEKFESTATMIVNTRQDQNANVTNDQLNSAKQLVLTYSIILKSDTVLDRVIQNLNLNSVPGFENTTSKTLAEDVIKINQVDTTQVLSISATTINPEISQQIVSEIVKYAPQMIINTVKAGSVEVISQPKVNYQKVYPSVFKNALIGALLGFVASVGVIVAFVLFDNTIKSDEDVTKKLGLPVIGVIPYID